MKNIKVGAQTMFKMLSDTLNKMKNSFMDFWNEFKKQSWTKIGCDLLIATIITVFISPIALALATVPFVCSIDDIVIGAIIATAVAVSLTFVGAWAAELLLIPVALSIAHLTRLFMREFEDALKAQQA